MAMHWLNMFLSAVCYDMRSSGSVTVVKGIGSCVLHATVLGQPMGIVCPLTPQWTTR